MPGAVNISSAALANSWPAVQAQEEGWVFYRFPGSSEIHFMAGEVVETAFDSMPPSGFTIAPFYRPQNKFWYIQNKMQYLLEDYNPAQFDGLFPFHYTAKKPGQTSSKPFYTNLVADVITEIGKGAFKKAVPARNKQVELPKEFSPFSLFKSLLGAYPNAFVYMLSTPNTGSWIGCTPETLLKVNDNALTTLSLAGTRKTNDPGQHPFTSKETEEQAIVTQYIHDTLTQYCTDIQAIGPQIIQAGNVSHLATWFQGTLRPAYTQNYLEILKALHPTPAVCGMPLQASRDYLLGHENFDRALYSGFLGPVDATKADIFVNLRCMQLFPNSALLYAGAGVVKGSDPEKEWAETEEKMNTLLRFL